MRLATRLRLSYFTVFVIPVMLILIVVLGMTNYSMNILKQKYDLDQVSFDMLLDPAGMTGHIAASAFERIMKTAELE